MNSLLALAVVLLNSLPPGLPCWWYGTVNVPRGSLLEAWGEYGHYATTTTFSDPEVGVVYQFYVPADDPSTPEREGAIDGEGIAFRLLEAAWPHDVIGWAQQIGWWQGGSSHNLDLYIEGGPELTPTATPSVTSELRLEIYAPETLGEESERGGIRICAVFGTERVCVTLFFDELGWLW